MDRIIRLPERQAPDLSGPEGDALAELMTRRLSIKPRIAHACNSRCITRLMPIQAWALYEMGICGGLLGNIPVGCGKTVLDLLSAMVIDDCRTAVLLVPPKLRVQLRAEYERLREHFRVPSFICSTGSDIVPGMPVLHVVPYSKLSQPESTVLLESIDPDLIIADEVHKLRDYSTATTTRFLRAFVKNPNRRFVGWSGTVMKDKISDFSHLSALALGAGSPVPTRQGIAKAWDASIDRGGRVLYRLGDLDGVQRRIANTRGVIRSSSGSVDCSLVMHEKKVKTPEEITNALNHLRRFWERPDGKQFAEAIELFACARQLSAGFYYRWVFPRREPKELIDEWYMARKLWYSELRERLKHRRPHLDSEYLATEAARRAWTIPNARKVGSLWELDGMPAWKAHNWERWNAVKDLVQPESEPVWLSDYLVEDAARWADKNKGVVWYTFDAFAERLKRHSPITVYGGGADENEIRSETGERSIACSVKAQGTGLDGLQFLFDRQLLANLPDGPEYEQLLGRLHRKGQKSDEVQTWLYRHTRELRDSYRKAVDKAERVFQTWQSSQKLLQASVTWKEKAE